MSRIFTTSRAGLAIGWLLLCLLSWWGGRAEIFSGQPARALASQAVDAPPGTSVNVPANEASVGAADEDRITAAIAEIGRLSKDGWVGGSDFAKFLRQGQKYRYAQSLPVPVLREVIERLAHDPSEGSAALAFDLAQFVLMERDPRGAFEAMNIAVSQGRVDVHYDKTFVFMVYAGKAPGEAVATWLQEYQETPPPTWMKPEQLRHIFNSFGFRDFDAALRAAEELPDPELRRTALAGLQGAMATFFPKDPAAWRSDAEARELAQKVIAAAGEGARQGLNAALSFRLRSEEPAATLTWYESLDLSPENRSWASKSLADAWAEKAPADAWTWYVAQAAPEQKSDALDRVVGQWTETETHFRDPLQPDLAACSEWLIGQGLGEASQKAMATLARAWARQSEPEAALAWARAIPSEEIRQTAEREVVAEIKKRFPAQWQQWVPESR